MLAISCLEYCMLSPTAKILQLGQSFMTKYDKVLVVKAISFIESCKFWMEKVRSIIVFWYQKKDVRAIQARGNLGSISRKFIIRIPHISTHTNHNIGIVSINFPCYLFIYLFICLFIISFFLALTVKH